MLKEQNQYVKGIIGISVSLTIIIVMTLLAGCNDRTSSVKSSETDILIQETDNEPTYDVTEVVSDNSVSVQEDETEIEAKHSIVSEPELEIMEVHFIDVGQADATLIKTDGHAMLVDCGIDEVGTKIQYYLQKQDIEKLDYLILTHPDSDHIGGADAIITKFDIDNVFMSPFTKDNNWYEDLLNALSYKGYSWSTPEVGTSYSLGDASFTVIAPNRTYEDPNNSSIAFILHFGDTSFLFTGDASEEAEADMVANDLDLSADVYKVGHHGSRSASTDDFLEKINPRYVVISCGTDNDYGHPHEEALQRIKRFSPEVYRTDEMGTIIAYSDGTGITWNHVPSTTWAHGVQIQEEVPVIYNDIMQLETTGDDAVPEARSMVLETTYILNNNSMRFHKPDCASVSEMNPQNRQDVNWTRKECIENGYIPCGYCKP